MKTLYIDCNMGAAGDMLMSALYELISDKNSFLRDLNRLTLPGVRFSARPMDSHGVAGTHMEVSINGIEEETADGGFDRDAAGLSNTRFEMRDIDNIIRGFALPEEVKTNIRNVYFKVADAEAKVHGTVPGNIHFHVIGTMDALADITGVCCAVAKIGADRIVSSPIHVGSGTVKCARGVLPVPAPATALLLRGIPVYKGEIKGELCTPTGAALLGYFADSFGERPRIKVDNIGYGIGTRDFGRASCVKVIEGELRAQ